MLGSALALAHLLAYRNCIGVLEQYNVNVNTKNKVNLDKQIIKSWFYIQYSQTPLHDSIVSGTIDHCSYLIDRVDNIDETGFVRLFISNL